MWQLLYGNTICRCADRSECCTWVSQSSSLTALSVTCRSISWVQILSFVSRRTSFLMASSTVAMDSVLSIMNVERCWGENSELYNWGVTVTVYLGLFFCCCFFYSYYSQNAYFSHCIQLKAFLSRVNCCSVSFAIKTAVLPLPRLCVQLLPACDYLATLLLMGRRLEKSYLHGHGTRFNAWSTDSDSQHQRPHCCNQRPDWFITTEFP